MKFDEFLFSHLGEMGKYQKIQVRYGYRIPIDYSIPSVRACLSPVYLLCNALPLMDIHCSRSHPSVSTVDSVGTVSSPSSSKFEPIPSKFLLQNTRESDPPPRQFRNGIV